jgi:hypothetical protein
LGFRVARKACLSRTIASVIIERRTARSQRRHCDSPISRASEEPYEEEHLRRLNDIPGVSIPDNAITRRPSIPLALFSADAAALEALKGVLDWFCETVRSDAAR